jgi:hypothetical protein
MRGLRITFCHRSGLMSNQHEKERVLEHRLIFIVFLNLFAFLVVAVRLYYLHVIGLLQREVYICIVVLAASNLGVNNQMSNT